MPKKVQKKRFCTYFWNIAKKLPENPSIRKLSVELFTDPVKLTVENYKDLLNIASIHKLNYQYG